MSLNSTTGYRSLSNNTPSCGTWYSSTSPCSTSSAGSRGWYINLVVGTAYDGERVVFTPLKVNYVLFFDTVIPKNIDPCTGGGTSWLYGVDAKTGGSAAIFTGLGNAVSGLPSTVGVMSDISFIATSSDGLSGNLYVEGSNGTFVSIPVNTCPGCSTPTAPANGRMTWRQLQ
jgi:Tfp pilus tip-associated adhesin PilY1